MAQLPSGWIAERPLEDDITNMQTDILSARCAADRLRLKTSISAIARAASRETVEKLLVDLQALFHFVKEIDLSQTSGQADRTA